MAAVARLLAHNGKTVELLLAHGADPDVHDHGEGLTPLMWAAQVG